MKRFTISLLVMGLATLFANAQNYPQVTIQDINTPVDLANCNDTSQYHMDTVTFVGYVVTDGSLTEVQSGSITGAGGIRPFAWMNDTANNGAVGPRTGLEVMGVNWNTSQATAGFTSLIEGEIVEVTGVVGMFDGATQFQPLNDNSLNVLPQPPVTNITPQTVPLGDLNNNNQVNQISTGQPYEGGFVKLKNVSITNVSTFGSGTSKRVNFTISDAQGNSMQVYDFFLGQKLTSWPTLNPNSPQDSGSFTVPSVGTFYKSISGVIEHQSNGCAGGNGVGYRLHPFKSSHYQVGQAVPTFSNVSNMPNIPSSSDSITLSADVVDADGTIDTLEVFWSTNASTPVSNFNSNKMTQTTGNTYEYIFSPQPNNTEIRYYIRAVDNDTNVSYYPNKPISQPEPDVAYVYVRDNGLTIMDVQTPIGSGDASPFEGQTVTVRGYVSAATRQCDLGFVYIQDTTANEYSGLALRGSLDLTNLYRGQGVEVEGTIEESFGFTTMQISSISGLSSYHKVEPVVLDPSDTIGYDNLEKYESVLVSYENPNGQIVVSNPDLGFGEYAISTDTTLNGTENSRRVLAGRQNGTQAQSSLHVQLVSDTAFNSQDGNMVYPPIKTQKGQSMDAITGVLWYSFGTYKLTPRNNLDLVNPSVSLDTANCEVPDNISVEKVASEGQIQVYPNPAGQVLNIELPARYESGAVQMNLFNTEGVHLKTADYNGQTILPVNDLANGVYILRIARENGALLSTQKVVISR